MKPRRLKTHPAGLRRVTAGTIAKARSGPMPTERAQAGLGPHARKVRELAKIMVQYDLSEVELCSGGETLRVRRGEPKQAGAALEPPAVLGHPASHAPTAQTPSRTPALPAEPSAGGTYLTSPFVGTFYRSPTPDRAVFVEVGQPIKKGQVLCIIEAMKLMNEIESEVDGTVLEILVENAQPVEYGERLFRIGP